ncbi:MAG: serine/threonine protein kinase [Minicystis sp.]
MSTRAILLVLALAAAGCGRPFVAATPPGFVDLGDRYGAREYRATTADGVVLGVRAFDNDPKGEIAFWSRALERRTREMAGYALLDKRDVATSTGLKGVQMRFGHDEGKEPYLYYLVLFVTDAKIYVLEAGGPKAEVTKQEAQIDWAIRNFAQK